jgi:hypothetical protein
MEGPGAEPTQVLDSREALTPVFEDLNRYQATMHFNGQSTIALDGDRATGISYCIAHHRPKPSVGLEPTTPSLPWRPRAPKTS